VIIALPNRRLNPPIPPLVKGGEGGLFTKRVRRRVISDSGFTLVEVMIALVISLLIFLALMQTALIGIDSNMRNVVRDEAVKIAEMRMNEMRNSPFVSVISDGASPLSDYDSSCESGCNDCPTEFSTGKCRCRNLRNIPKFKFCTQLTCQEIGGDGNCATNDADNKQVRIVIGWKWKGDSYTHSVTTIRKR
jgi:prepilin-type N-terminal cleavage/methylation domain-containing protein